MFILLFYIFINFPSTKVAVVCRNVIVQQCESLRSTLRDKVHRAQVISQNSRSPILAGKHGARPDIAMKSEKSGQRNQLPVDAS